MPARGRRGGGFPLWLGIILLIALGVILWLFLKGEVFSNDSTTSVGSDTTAGGSAAPGDSQGTITVGNEDLLGLAADGNGALVDLEGQTVTGDAVVVQSMVGDGAFWVGTDVDNRVLVVPNAGDTPDPSVGAGGRVSFSGTLQPLPLDFADRFGISSSEDVDLLTAQGHYVQATEVHAAT